ncbi:MAG TPA: hypothetical protein P5076_24440, partial [Myxococcota bacterium]|nr:hypothetical protein [Myxococcota bacterium]
MRGLEHGLKARAGLGRWLVALAALAAAGCDGGGGGPEDVCEGYLCSGHGTCVDQAGEPVCECEPGYTRADCGLCAAGYHDDGTGACLPDQVVCQADSCSGHGACDDSTGALVCTCDPGYAGDTCAACAAGYHDDGAGGCVPDGDA